MASLCNYTQHWLQNTSSLQRQGHGVFFPYNPEFYDRASGLYGPGAIIAWNLLFVSLVINTIVSSFPDKEPAQHDFWSGMSGELVTFVAYPMFAATDLVVHGIKLIGYEDRDEALYCLRDFRSQTADQQDHDNVEPPQHPLDLADIPPHILSLGQRIVQVTGPLDVSYGYFASLAVWTISTLATRGSKRTAATVLVGAGSMYVVLLVFIFHCTLGSFTTGVFIIPYMEVVRLLWKAMAAVWLPFSLFIFVGGAVLLPVDWYMNGRPRQRSDDPDSLGAIGTVAGFIISAGLFVLIDFTWFGPLRPTSPWVPDLGVALLEQDQLAALIAASMSLCYTLYCAVRRIRINLRRDDGDTVELHDSLLPSRDEHDEEALAGL